MLAVGLMLETENADFHINQTQTALTSSVRSQTVLSYDIWMFCHLFSTWKRLFNIIFKTVLFCE